MCSMYFQEGKRAISQLLWSQNSLSSLWFWLWLIEHRYPIRHFTQCWLLYQMLKQTLESPQDRPLHMNAHCLQSLECSQSNPLKLPRCNDFYYEVAAETKIPWHTQLLILLTFKNLGRAYFAEFFSCIYFIINHLKIQTSLDIIQTIRCRK